MLPSRIAGGDRFSGLLGLSLTVAGVALMAVGAGRVVTGADPTNTCRSHFARVTPSRARPAPPMDHHCEVNCPSLPCAEVHTGQHVNDHSGNEQPGYSVFRCGCGVDAGATTGACDGVVIRDTAGSLHQVTCKGTCPKPEEEECDEVKSGADTTDPERPVQKLRWLRCRCICPSLKSPLALGLVPSPDPTRWVVLESRAYARRCKCVSTVIGNGGGGGD